MLFYLLRGMIGMGLLAVANWLANLSLFRALLAGIGAFVAFRGCALCSLVGVCEVLPRSAGASGSCNLPGEQRR